MCFLLYFSTDGLMVLTCRHYLVKIGHPRQQGSNVMTVHYLQGFYNLLAKILNQ